MDKKINPAIENAARIGVIMARSDFAKANMMQLTKRRSSKESAKKAVKR
jgi:hypothetical protein